MTMALLKELLKKHIGVLDILMVPMVLISALMLREMRRAGVYKFKYSKKILIKIGVFPINKHYYEPQIDYQSLDYEANKERSLPGINLNVSGQIDFLGRMIYAKEFSDYILNVDCVNKFEFGNKNFESGDAEYWYQIIRIKKPKLIIEIGAGHSTKIAARAIEKNNEEGAQKCRHICIEPFEMPWLDDMNVDVIREKVEDVDISLFSELQEDDLLFIDSSHIIRPMGDVVREYLQILPTLNHGVIVHVHDIFTPRNYPEKWIVEKQYFWNEQFLLEAFLCDNSKWEIVGALNYLHHHCYDQLHAVAPFLEEQREPGSFYIRKLNS